MGLISNMKQIVKAGVSAETEDANMITIPAGTNREILAGYQEVLYGAFEVSGAMVVSGLLIVDVVPT